MKQPRHQNERSRNYAHAHRRQQPTSPPAGCGCRERESHRQAAKDTDVDLHQHDGGDHRADERHRGARKAGAVGGECGERHEQDADQALRMHRFVREVRESVKGEELSGHSQPEVSRQSEDREPADEASQQPEAQRDQAAVVGGDRETQDAEDSAHQLVIERTVQLVVEVPGEIIADGPEEVALVVIQLEDAEHRTEPDRRESQGCHPERKRGAALQLRSIERMLMKKLANTVCEPSASSTTAGITSRIVSEGSRLPKPTAPQLATATTSATTPISTMAAPAARPTSSVT